ncbi:DivIVA domain-containing protein [Candidatus Aerophobetes bacterium]|nr:DivIVA domain-containing protein [Candidatus Aerophobetes bacterium]
MNINLFKIKEKDFSLSLRGYNKKEVKEFIENIAQTLEMFINKNEKLSEEIGELKQKLDEYRLKEEQINSLLTSAREKAEIHIKQSEEKANFIIKEAQISAEKIQQQEQEKLEKLQTEVKRLYHQKKLLIEKLKTFIQTQTELLKFFEEENTSSESFPPPLPFFLNKSVKKVTFDE